MRTSDSIKEIAPAFVKAQAAMEGAKKDSHNPHFKSQFADLASVMAAVRAPFVSQGLAHMQEVLLGEHGVEVVTRIIHASGEWFEFGPLIVPVSKDDAQGVGSAITYGKRYALQAACGLASEDDDGNAAAAKPPQRANDNRSQARTAPKPVDDRPAPWLTNFRISLEKHLPKADRDSVLKWISERVGRDIPTSKDLTQQECNLLLTTKDMAPDEARERILTATGKAAA